MIAVALVVAIAVSRSARPSRRADLGWRLDTMKAANVELSREELAERLTKSEARVRRAE